MSPETFRLSQFGSKEQNGGQEEDKELRDDLKARTSELQLRRPSRRELRMQREANEAKAVEQSEKRSTQFDSTPAASPTPTERQSSGRVHTFSLSSLERSALLAQLEEEKKPSVSPSVPAPEETKKTALDMSIPTASQGPSVKETADSPASPGRSSLFDRFGDKDNKDSISFRDRLVERTREEQEEPRRTEPVLPGHPFEFSSAQSDRSTQAFDPFSNEPEAKPESKVRTSIFSGSLPVADTPEDAESDKEAPRTEVSDTKRSFFDRMKNSKPSVDDTAVVDTTEDKTSVVAAVSDQDSEKDLFGDIQKKSEDAAAVAEDGRYPTDVSMRLSDDDEEKTGGDRLVSALIILIGILAGVVVGLIVQRVIFGAEGIDTYPVYSVQAAAQSYLIGS